MSEKLLVSACLAGFPCRYDGKTKPVKEIVELVESGKAIPFCPEVEGGLPTPRIPSEQLKDKVINEEGIDVTENYNLGAKKALEVCQNNNISKAILKAKSPSCGVGKVYDGTFSGTLIEGDGVTTTLLKDNNIKVINEEDYLREIPQ